MMKPSETLEKIILLIYPLLLFLFVDLCVLPRLHCQTPLGDMIKFSKTLKKIIILIFPLLPFLLC